MNGFSLASSTFSPQHLVSNFKALQSPAASRMIEMPMAPVYVAAASPTGLPVKFRVDLTPRTSDDPSVSPLLREALAQVVADPKDEINGQSSSVSAMKFDSKTSSFDLVVRPTEFFMGRAVARILSKNPDAIDLSYLEKNSPHMLNVSLIVITEIAGHRYLLCQEKGKAIGSGSIHTLFAGNVAVPSIGFPRGS